MLFIRQCTMGVDDVCGKPDIANIQQKAADREIL